MPIPPETTVEICTKDILSWYYDEPTFDQDRPIYIDALNTDRHWTANQCRKAIKQLAAGFRNLGLKNGDTVCIYSFNSLDYPVLANGIIGAGCVFTGCNPSYSKFELVHHLRTSQANVIIVEPELIDTCLKAAAEVGLPHSRVLLFDEKGSPAEKQYGLQSWRRLFDYGELDWPRFDSISTATNTTAALLYSSGTTGLPKAAMLSHHNLIAEATLFVDWKGTTWHRKRLAALPMFHAATVPLILYQPLHSGDQVFILRRFELESYLQAVQEHQITEGAFVPPMVHLINASPLTKKYSMKSIKQAHAGAAPLDAGSQARFRKLLSDQATFAQLWGMTESSCVACCLPWEYGDEVTGAVGKMLPNMSAKLCDDDGNDITADDVRGELCIKGPLVCQGYYLNPEANTRDWDAEGYFHTGDIAYRSSKNQLWYIVDRKKELIKVRGFQVSPSEVEAALMSHPDIVEAAVIGIAAQNKVDGEEPRAYVTLKEGSTTTPSDIQGHVAERLARYKHCTGGIVIMKDIPKNPSGKKLKRVLLEQAKKELAVKRPQAKI